MPAFCHQGNVPADVSYRHRIVQRDLDDELLNRIRGRHRKIWCRVRSNRVGVNAVDDYVIGDICLTGDVEVNVSLHGSVLTVNGTLVPRDNASSC